MSRDTDAVQRAIDRWEEALLVDAETAERLRREATQHAGSGTRRLSQYLLATTGGVALLLAGGMLMDWAWPLLEREARSAMLAAAGILVLVAGVWLEGGRRWLPASYLMQTSGLCLLLFAFAYSEVVWRDGTPGGVVVGVLALAVPIVFAPRAIARGTVMPAVHLAFGFAFLAIFLDRATPLGDDGVVWILDGVLSASIIVLVRLLLADPAGARHPWTLNAFIAAIVAGFVLVAWTSVEVLSMGDDVMYPLDAWLALAAALTLWGRHAGPEDLRRDWFGGLLTMLMLLWSPFGFLTALETMNGPPELALLMIGGVGATGFVYGNSEGLRALMGASVLAFVLALWWWAVERGGALGAIAALAATAGLLFWVSGKVAASPDTAEPAG